MIQKLPKDSDLFRSLLKVLCGSAAIPQSVEEKALSYFENLKDYSIVGVLRSIQQAIDLQGDLRELLGNSKFLDNEDWLAFEKKYGSRRKI